MLAGTRSLPEFPGARFVCEASKRTESWQGVAQEVQGRLRTCIDYNLQALVSIAGNCDEATVLATLKLENNAEQPQHVTLARQVLLLPDHSLHHLHFSLSHPSRRINLECHRFSRASVRRGDWTWLNGRLRVETSSPVALVFVEGPPPGVDILLACLVLTPAAAQPAAPMAKV